MDGIITNKMITGKELDLYLIKDGDEIYWALSWQHTNCQTSLIGPDIKIIASVRTITGDEATCDDAACTICNSKRQNPHHL